METENIHFTIEKSRPLILIISGLSGSGKDSVINRMQELSETVFHFVVTCNTRKRRENEVDGKDYHFISREKFLDMIEKNEMIEYSQVYDDLKGVPRFEIEKALAEGNDMILRVDYQGMKKIKSVYPEAISIFIIPPDAETWLSRLRNRGTDSEESLQLRIQTGERELADSSGFDYIVVNDRLDKAAADILSIIHAEHIRTSNRKVVLD